MKLLTNNPPDQSSSSNLPPWFPALVLGLLWLFMVAPGLWMGFHADDWFQIRPRSLAEVLSTFVGDWNTGHRGEGGFFRPLVRLSFYCDQLLFGLRPWGYHLTNGLIFGGLIAGLYRSAQVLCPGRRGATTFILAIGLVMNPLKNEALYWISGRTDLLASMFIVWSLYFTLRATRDDDENQSVSIKSALIALGLLCLGLLSKEVALSACVILPIMAVLLSSRPGFSRSKTILALGPIALGTFYFLYRSFILGGLAGYKTAEPHTVAELVGNLTAMLSALWCPWQSGAANTYAPAFGILALGLLFIILFWTRLRRDLLALTLAMVLALGPMVMIRIAPFDGDRVLVLGLCFQVLLFCCFFIPPRKPRFFLQEMFAFVAVIGCGLMQISNMSIIREFILAKGGNDRVVEQTWSVIETAPDGAVVVLPPEFPLEKRHYLNKGKMMVMAMETLWKNEIGGTSRHEFDYSIPRVVMELESKNRTVSVVVTLQSWMKNPTLIYWTERDQVVPVSLSRQSLTDIDGTTQSRIHLAEGEFLLVETMGRNLQLATPISSDRYFTPTIELADPSGPDHCQWWLASPKESDQPTTVTLPKCSSPLRYRRVVEYQENISDDKK